MRNRRTSRLGLVLAYAVATVWAQAGHLHGHHADPDSETHCQVACGDASPHLSGHSSVDLGRASGDCSACQLRSAPLIVAPETPRPIEPGRVRVSIFAAPALRPIPVARPTGRAPPLS